MFRKKLCHIIRLAMDNDLHNQLSEHEQDICLLTQQLSFELCFATSSPVSFVIVSRVPLFNARWRCCNSLWQRRCDSRKSMILFRAVFGR